jgi:dephospho-CoA kinase
MFILTCGLPGSGKSKVIDILSAGLGWHIIRPSDWIPDDLSALDEKTEREYLIGCWSLAIDKAKEAIAQIPPRDVIVLDSGNSKFNTTRLLICDAKKMFHKVAMLFVNSNVSLCKTRNTKLTDTLLRDYAERFKSSLPLYKKACDLFLVVNNNGTIEHLETELHDVLKILCHNI